MTTRQWLPLRALRSSSQKTSQTLLLAPSNPILTPKTLWPQSFIARRAFAVRAPKSAWDKDIFRADKLPVHIFNSAVTQSPEIFHRMNGPEYFKYALRFSALVQRGVNPFAVCFDCGKEKSGPILHDLGCILRHHPFKGFADRWSIALWASASELGCVPSTLSLAQNLVVSGHYLRIYELSKVEARFQHLVAQGRDPNALTVQGRWLMRQGRVNDAILMFQRALKLGRNGNASSNTTTSTNTTTTTATNNNNSSSSSSSNNSINSTSNHSKNSFHWETNCSFCLAKAYLELNRPDDAMAIFLPLAERGYLQAHAEVAKLLRASDPEKAEQHMWVAACAGSDDMFTHLSELTVERARALEETDKEESRELHMWAVEWSRLANWREPH